MDADRLREAAEKLEQEVDKALAAGYGNADCVLTTELLCLIRLAKASQILEPVRLEYTAGLAWNFFETRLGECVGLEGAWHHVLWLVEDCDSSREMVADRARRPFGYEV